MQLFVYGSLKRGFLHHDQLAGARWLREALTEPGWALARHDGYPLLLRVPGAPGVYGELYEAPLALLPALDRFEGAAYERVALRLADGSSAESYVGCAALASTTLAAAATATAFAERWTLADQQRD